MSTEQTRREAHQASAHFTPSLAQQVRHFILGRGEHGATCDEVEASMELRHQTASARIHELMKAGSIVDSGTVRKTRSNRNAVVWVVPLQ